MHHYYRPQGFSLIEMLVIVAIVAILSTVVVMQIGSSGGQARDAERQAELRALEIAIENYRKSNGRYPVGAAGVGQWSVQHQDRCENEPLQTDAYICGLVPRYTNEVPFTSRGSYQYTTNSDRTVFKLVAHQSVESGVSPMSACPEWCTEPCDEPTTMAVWGGFAASDGNGGGASATEDVVCSLPESP